LAICLLTKWPDYYLPRGLPAAAEARADSTDALQTHVRRLLDLRGQLPPVPRPARFSTLARHRSTVPEGKPHRLVWSRHGARCSDCYKLFRTRHGWTAVCPGTPTASMGAFTHAKGKRHNLATFAMAGKSAGLLVACLRCACFSQFTLCKLGQQCTDNPGTRGAFLRRLLQHKHSTDPSSYVQHVLRPWPRATLSQRATLAIPAILVAAPARGPATRGAAVAPAMPCAVTSSSSVAASVPASTASSSSAASPASSANALASNSFAAAGVPPSSAAPAVSSREGDLGPPAAAPAPDEEWDLGQLEEWFGDSGL
jgi:hypothetical protein